MLTWLTRIAQLLKLITENGLRMTNNRVHGDLPRGQGQLLRGAGRAWPRGGGVRADRAAGGGGCK